jgi:hypothetical protein
MVLFLARRRFLINHLKTKGFLWIIEARIAPDQGEKRDNREKQGANREMSRVKQSGESRARKRRAAASQSEG